LKIIERNIKLLLGIKVNLNVYNILNFYDISNINYQNAKDAISTLNLITTQYEKKFNVSNSRIKSWVNQRKIKIAKALFVQKKTISAFILLPNIFEILTDRYTYFNIYNTTIRLINAKLNR